MTKLGPTQLLVTLGVAIIGFAWFPLLVASVVGALGVTPPFWLSHLAAYSAGLFGGLALILGLTFFTLAAVVELIRTISRRLRLGTRSR